MGMFLVRDSVGLSVVLSVRVLGDNGMPGQRFLFFLMDELRYSINSRFAANRSTHGCWLDSAAAPLVCDVVSTIGGGGGGGARIFVWYTLGYRYSVFCCCCCRS